MSVDTEKRNLTNGDKIETTLISFSLLNILILSYKFETLNILGSL